MIIGITGYAGAGKSTAARVLSSRHGFVRRPFAYPLKAMLGALGVPAEALDGTDEIKRQPMALFAGRSLREAMQTLGTEWGRREFGSDFWVRQWVRGLDSLGDVVADDVRFPEESQIIKRLGGAIIRIDRDGAGPASDHSSETSVDLIAADYVIKNTAGPDMLAASVDFILADLRKDLDERRSLLQAAAVLS